MAAPSDARPLRSGARRTICDGLLRSYLPLKPPMAGIRAIFAVAAVDALAALYHHFVRRDGVLVRMLPGGTG